MATSQLVTVYEHYYNSPEEVPESELLTKIVFLGGVTKLKIRR